MNWNAQNKPFQQTNSFLNQWQDLKTGDYLIAKKKEHSCSGLYSRNSVRALCWPKEDNLFLRINLSDTSIQMWLIQPAAFSLSFFIQSLLGLVQSWRPGSLRYRTCMHHYAAGRTQRCCSKWRCLFGFEPDSESVWCCFFFYLHAP